MSTEAKFRRAWEAALRRHIPLLAYMASMNREGVPDEHAILEGRCYWLELKAFDGWPKSLDANVLGHRFTGPQLTFLRKVDRAQGRGLGVVGFQVDGVWNCVCLRVHDIGDDGAVSRREIERHRWLPLDDSFPHQFLTLLTRS
jgi:hypothetical protein